MVSLVAVVYSVGVSKLHTMATREDLRVSADRASGLWAGLLPLDIIACGPEERGGGGCSCSAERRWVRGLKESGL